MRSRRRNDRITRETDTRMVLWSEAKMEGIREFLKEVR